MSFSHTPAQRTDDTEGFDAIVVGSGFGGSVAAYELSKAGMSVCLLERGRAYPPGTFARTPRDMGKNFWDPSKKLFGLFDIWTFKNSEAIISSGLGGGSLIYANVLIRMPREWFARTTLAGRYCKWPISYAELEPHYEEVERMLGANPYPIEDLPGEFTGKARAFRAAASKSGLDCIHPNLAISFRAGSAVAIGHPLTEDRPNLHGAPRATCRHCGECDVGCNYGSKNTLDLNYLSAAKEQGAQIRPLCEVRQLAPIQVEDPSCGYLVRYVQHDPGSDQDSGKLPLRTAQARNLVLAAGTLGSTYLLLKNRDSFPKISKKLGSQYSTNGDLIALSLPGCDQTDLINVIDVTKAPVITSSAQVNFTSGSGGQIQDAGYPAFIAWIAETGRVRGNFWRLIAFVWRRIRAWLFGRPSSVISADIANLLGPAQLSSGTLPLLGMGCDEPDGRMYLRRSPWKRESEFLDVDWTMLHSIKCFGALTSACFKLSKALRGNLVENVLTTWLSRIITVHPLGGCPMASAVEDGVVDPQGQVFEYPGLFVVDGSVMPGPTGANPSLTIAATSRLISLGIARRHHASDRTEDSSWAKSSRPKKPPSSSASE